MLEPQIVDELAELCVKVLETNDQGSYTVPSTSVYPHQWLWDSCFSAIGWRHIDTDRAKQEIVSLLRGQWSNGMVPHMIFKDDKAFRRERAIWSSHLSPFSPDNHATSGITQPPLIAEAVWLVGQSLKKAERNAFFKEVLPYLINYHTWLFAERDPHDEGLTLQIHPYETGLDSTPPWLIQLHEHSRPWWITGIEALKLDVLINHFRRDTKQIPNEQRMSNIDALLYWDIVRRLKRKRYDISRILHRSHFVIEDVSFNSIFIKANQRLIDIAKEARIKLPEELLENISKSNAAFEGLWDESSKSYFSRDFITHELIKEPSIGGMLALYSGVVPEDRVQVLVEQLTEPKYFWLNYPIPSVPLSSHFFSAVSYWQGPTWINTNWLVINALEEQGYTDVAKELVKRTLQMIHKSGIFEYYSPIDGRGLGAENFSWTAALTLDLLARYTD